jgi:hypothetical protein
MKKSKILNIGNICNLFDGKPRVNKVERVLLMDAINNHGGEVVEPANDDVKMMETIVSLYNKGFVVINFKKDKLFVSDLFLSTLPQN